MGRAGINSKRIGIYQFNSIPELQWELELKDLKNKLIELELKFFELELTMWYFCATAKDILQTVGSIVVQAMVFNDQEKLDNEAVGQTLASN